MRLCGKEFVGNATVTKRQSVGSYALFVYFDSVSSVSSSELIVKERATAMPTTIGARLGASIKVMIAIPPIKTPPQIAHFRILFLFINILRYSSHLSTNTYDAPINMYSFWTLA